MLTNRGLEWVFICFAAYLPEILKRFVLQPHPCACLPSNNVIMSLYVSISYQAVLHHPRTPSRETCHFIVGRVLLLHSRNVRQTSLEVGECVMYSHGLRVIHVKYFFKPPQEAVGRYRKHGWRSASHILIVSQCWLNRLLVFM